MINLSLKNTNFQKNFNSIIKFEKKQIAFKSLDHDSFVKKEKDSSAMENPKVLYNEIKKMLESDNEKAVLKYLYDLADYTRLILGTCSPEDVKKTIQLLVDQSVIENNNRKLIKMLEIIRNAVYPKTTLGEEIDFSKLSNIETDNEYCNNLIKNILSQTIES